MQYEQARLEILMDLLKTYLNIKVKESPTKNTKIHSEAYANGYFLGDHKVRETVSEVQFPPINKIIICCSWNL